MTVDQELKELWMSLMAAERKALCDLAYLDPSVAVNHWIEISTDHRMRLMRAMVHLSDFALVCARGLERARGALN